MKLLKGILSIMAVAVAFAGIVYLLLTGMEGIMNKVNYFGDKIRDFFYDVADRFFSEDDFCECCSCCEEACSEAAAEEPAVEDISAEDGFSATA